MKNEFGSQTKHKTSFPSNTKEVKRKKITFYKNSKRGGEGGWMVDHLLCTRLLTVHLGPLTSLSCIMYCILYTCYTSRLTLYLIRRYCILCMCIPAKAPGWPLTQVKGIMHFVYMYTKQTSSVTPDPCILYNYSTMKVVTRES